MNEAQEQEQGEQWATKLARAAQRLGVNDEATAAAILAAMDKKEARKFLAQTSQDHIQF